MYNEIIGPCPIWTKEKSFKMIDPATGGIE
jgi:hypothetical protein